MSLNPIDWVKEGFNYIIYNFVYTLLYYLEVAICKLLDWTQELMDVFTGTTQVTYGNEQDYLINIFLGNKAISGVYLGMAAIGIVFAFTFAVVSVIRKLFDSGEKVKMSFGQILTNLFKSILMIILLNAGMTVIVTASNLLMQQVVYVFDHAEDLANGSDKIEYTDEQYAAMARIFNTIGNYSLNPSYKNRYNINSCYNEIRGDLVYLDSQGVFDFYYETKDAKNNVVVTWQSLLQEIAIAADFNQEIPVDVYNEGVANALYHVMDEMRNNPSIMVLQSYERIEEYDSNEVSLGRTLFLVGTMGNGITAAAKNDKYNVSPSLTDAVRAPYYRGEKSVYSLSQVNKDFDIAISKTNYIIVYVAGVLLGSKMALIIVTCVARLFNLLFLYVIAPPVFGIMPLDDGGKVKQWTTAFIVQAFSVFATVISMRIYLIFLPIILSPSLTLSKNIIVDMFGRVITIFAGINAITKANGILTGILADNAGWQSISAGDMQGYLQGSFLGKLGARAVGFANTIPARAVGGKKLSNFLDGKKNDPKESTGGVVGLALGAMRGLASGAKGGAKSGLSAAKSSISGIKGDIKGDAGGASSGQNSGNQAEGKEAAIPPQQRNVGGK